MRIATTLLAALVLSLLAPSGAPLAGPMPAPPGSAFHAGTGWSDVGGTMSGSVVDVVVADDGTVYAGATFLVAGGVSAQYIAMWDGTAWVNIGDANDWVFALALDADGNLYAGGRFTTIGGVDASRIARWDGTAWSALGPGFNNPVEALVFGDDGTLYAGGSFRIVGDNSGLGVAQWDGSSWSYVGGGTSDVVYGLALGPDGDLYAGGSFLTAGGVTVNRIARWDGAAWSSVGGGVTQVGGGPTVYTLAFGPEGDLYAGGAFDEIGGGAANNLARWDGTNWTEVGGGVTGTTGGTTAVLDLVFDGAGDLYAGGSFTEAGPVTVNAVARWDGTAWVGLDGGIGNGRVETLVVAFPYLYAGGGFSDMGGDPALDFLARWEGVGSVASEPPAGSAPAVLEAAYPNPLRQDATVRFTVAQAGAARLELFDVLGRRVAVLFDGTVPAGQAREVGIDARALPTGMYMLRLTSNAVTASRRLTVVR